MLRLAQQVGIRGRARCLAAGARARGARCGFVIDEAGRAPLTGQPVYSEEEPRERAAEAPRADSMRRRCRRTAGNCYEARAQSTGVVPKKRIGEYCP